MLVRTYYRQIRQGMKENALEVGLYERQKQRHSTFVCGNILWFIVNELVSKDILRRHFSVFKLVLQSLLGDFKHAYRHMCVSRCFKIFGTEATKHHRYKIVTYNQHICEQCKS